MNYTIARTNMVEHQVNANGVHDRRLLDAFAELPREVFLPKDKRSFAYLDSKIDLGHGHYALDPMVLGRLINAAEITPSDIVLCLGDPTGYASAIISQLAQTVIAVENDPAWVKFSSNALSGQNIDNVVVVRDNPLVGFPQEAPYDVILFCGAISKITAELCGQLNDNGRLLAVLRQPNSPMGQAILALRVNDSWSERNLFDAAIPSLVREENETEFTF